MSEETVDLYIALISLAVSLFLIVLGFVAGGMFERRHYKSIRSREHDSQNVPVVTVRGYDTERAVAESQLVSASVVVSLDYFKRILAGLRNIFGGRVRSYESLLDRAKREAILRLKEQAPRAHIIVNMRMNTSQIATPKPGRKGIGAVEVLAVGTAIRYL